MWIWCRRGSPEQKKCFALSLSSICVSSLDVWRLWITWFYRLINGGDFRQRLLEHETQSRARKSPDVDIDQSVRYSQHIDLSAWSGIFTWRFGQICWEATMCAQSGGFLILWRWTNSHQSPPIKDSIFNPIYLSWNLSSLSSFCIWQHLGCQLVLFGIFFAFCFVFFVFYSSCGSRAAPPQIAVLMFAWEVPPFPLLPYFALLH